MSVLTKTYLYKVYRAGVYLGMLPNPSSDFSYSQDINSAGAQIQIDIPISADTADQAPGHLLTEGGDYINTEDGRRITTERQPDLVGNTDGVLIRNNNDLLIYELSDDYPNGKLMFTGYISSWQANFGGSDDDQITIIALSNGTELQNVLIEGEIVADQSQITNNSSQQLQTNGTKSGYQSQVWQSFTVGGGITNLAAVTFLMSANSSQDVGEILQLDIYASQGNAEAGINSLGFVQQPLASTTPTVQTFTLPTPINVVSGTTYYAKLSSLPLASVFYGIAYQSGNPYSGGSSRYADLNTSGVWTDMPSSGDLYFETYYTTSATLVPFTGEDPSAILTDVMTNYFNKGGKIMLDPSIANTGVDVDYDFKVNTVLEGIQVLLGLAPADWYWYVDIATQILYFKQASTTPFYTFVKGNNITSLQLKATIENLKNVIYFSGGDTGGGANLFVKYADTDSIAANNNRIGLDRISDSNVTDAPTGLVLAQNDANGNNAESYQTQVSIAWQTMDITLPKVGDTIGFAGFGTFIDDLILQIVRVQYTPEILTLTVGTLPPRINLDIQQLKNNVTALQTLANPSSPS